MVKPQKYPPPFRARWAGKKEAPIRLLGPGQFANKMQQSKQPGGDGNSGKPDFFAITEEQEKKI